MGVAELYAKRSTCDRLHVGAVLAMDARIISTGYNGAPAGIPHCDPGPHEGPSRTAIHAEQNAVAFAARNGSVLNGSQLVITHMPCLNCSLMLINTGIACVVYLHPFRDQSGIELLNEAGIRCVPYFERLDD
jgi:dCMP deaminase